MLKKVKLTQVDIYEKTKDGKMLTYKNREGKDSRYKKIRIGIEGMTDRLWGAIWSSQSPMNSWEQDMEVTIDIEKDNQGYWHFKLPNKDSEINDRIDKIEKRLSVLEIKTKKIESDVYEPEVSPTEPIKAGYNERDLDPMEVSEPLEDEIKPEDLPF